MSLAAPLDEQADVDLDELTAWESRLAEGPGSPDGEGYECRACHKSMSIDDYEPTMLCHHCAQDFVEEMGSKLLALARRALGPEAKGERIRIEQHSTGATPEGPWGNLTLSISTQPARDWTVYERSNQYSTRFGRTRVVEAVILDASEPDHRKRSEMCERFLREHGYRLRQSVQRYVATFGADPCEEALDALMKEFGLGK